MPKSGWVSLDSCIYDYINEAELSQSKYFKLFHLAYRCFEDLGMDFFYSIRSTKIQVNANNTAYLPENYLKYTKIGVLNGIGELAVLKYNDNLTSLGSLMPERLSGIAGSNFMNYYSYSSPVFFNYFGDGGFDNLYGVSSVGLYGGGFKIDEGNGVIILDPSFGWTNLVMEYTAVPMAGEEYLVPVEFKEAIVAFLAWRDIFYPKAASSHFNLGEKDRRRHEYFEAVRRGIQKYHPFYLDQAYIQSMEATRLTVKA